MHLTYGRDLYLKNNNRKVNKGLFVMRKEPDEVWGGEIREGNLNVKQLNKAGWDEVMTDTVTVDQCLLHQLLFQEATPAPPSQSTSVDWWWAIHKFLCGTYDKFYHKLDHTAGLVPWMVATTSLPWTSSQAWKLWGHIPGGEIREITRSLWPEAKHSPLCHRKQQARAIQCRAVGIARGQGYPEPQWEVSSQSASAISRYSCCELMGTQTVLLS